MPRVTIYVTEDTDTLLGSPRSLSGRIRAVIGRYAQVIEESMPELTRDEWCAILEANSGAQPLDGHARPSLLWANVSDQASLGPKWGVDIDQLVATMRGWSTAETMAAIEACGRFDNLDKPVDQALADCGCRIRRDV